MNFGLDCLLGNVPPTNGGGGNIMEQAVSLGESLRV